MKAQMRTRMAVMMAMVVAVLLNATPVMAQKKVADKELVGVWLMQSMQYDGEDVIRCGKDFRQVKIFGPKGEYSAISIALSSRGDIRIFAGEHGTYTFKNGVYSEMGREATTDGVVLKDKTTFQGRFHNRTDIWKKATKFPEELETFLIEKSKSFQGPSAKMQRLIKDNCFE